MSAPLPLPEILTLLACPACHGNLHRPQPERLVCAACGRVYPLLDGIPALTPDRAKTKPAEAEQTHP